MTEEEREQEKREILEKFGPNAGEILRKARLAREGKLASSEPPLTDNKASDHTSTNSTPASPRVDRVREGRTARSVSPPSAMSRPGTRPSSRIDRNVRFAEVTSDDIYVYESAPPSPRKKALALPAPTESDGPTISLGKWKGGASSAIRRRGYENLSDETRLESNGEAGSPGILELLEEGTPEDIRRRFFPQAPAHDPSLAWIEGPTSSEPSRSSELRFDLTGTPIPPALSATLPTYLGLHHHAEGDRAGYTLEDILLLSRSTVPAQRASMLGILGRIAKRLGRACRGDANAVMPELAGQEVKIRKRILAAGVEAMTERGSLGARAVEVMWECIVGWDEGVISIEGVELQDASRSGVSSENISTSDSGDPLSSLPLDYVLAQISSAFATAALPAGSLAQLLAILHRLAQHTNVIATKITTTPSLVSNVVQTFLLTPIPPREDSPLPDPFALQVLATLALASRENASALLGPADALLRFVTILPAVSPFSLPLSTALLTGTLQLFIIFASYGLYAHISTTASQHFSLLSRYVLSEECRSRQLREVWLRLLEAWMVCSRDPHHTTPSHEILWSQVVGWGWPDDIAEMKGRLTEQDTLLWAALWRAEAAWLEGARVNGMRSGEDERAAVVLAVRDGFQDGPEKLAVERSGAILSNVLADLGKDGARPLLVTDILHLQTLAEHADVLAAALRLWLSCVPSHIPGPLESSPFLLPFAQLSELCARITTHAIWQSIFAQGSISYAHVFCRPLSRLLACYLELSRKVPGTTEDLWIAQAFAILCRLMPGDEKLAQHAVSEMVDLVTPEFVNPRGWNVPPVIWAKGGLKVIKPFLTFALQPKNDFCVGPIWMSPHSISTATTQRLPPAPTVSPDSRREVPLPLPRDWMFSPLDHLLRSGESEVFKSMPSWWDASETEVVRATLLLARIGREVLHLNSLDNFVMNREETIFACMKVFMLEHGQQQNDSMEEVFRDRLVEQAMEDLVTPFVAAASTTSLSLPPASDTFAQPTLESIAARFLGPSTPFYQFYTDFVGLYDAISFSHPLFARLLLPPVSMRYPPDFRKHLWADYNHIVKTIRAPPEAVITANLGEYLWPVETDTQMITAYLRALMNGSLDGFVRLIAIHHIACNIWPDLHEGEDEKAEKLLLVVVDQTGLEVVREVVRYRQAKEGTILLPPACYSQEGNWQMSRLAFVQQHGGDALRERLEGLLQKSPS
ncbi:uncharacterized protein LAESUDRAFT_690776 [Laetiporus sulphureus 93-53]|uniref:Uncharacterized protein n=1 Tax=Laetiporus sulphureus 93-53 TaxID=1314785 RepID=A0A165HJC2_9APHY|nr:uncharacterized protein LAESUDRAFT_690776 [Laetiporus sulphureus 93-53]KZT11801.1 hypothetical protein LAESUDRAFT_690776 [Laetiporus sulphureus 93-53]